MAINTNMRVSASLEDAFGIRDSVVGYARIDPAATVTQLDGYWSSWIAAIDGLSDAQVVGGSWEVFPTLPGGIKTAPTAGTPVEKTEVMNFANGTSSHRWGMDIPAISNGTTVLNGTDRLILTSADPADVLIQLLTTALTLINWANSAYQPITAFRDALLSYRKKGRRALTRSSLVVP